jgi:hypothetical protein
MGCSPPPPGRSPVYLVNRLCTISAALSGAFISSISNFFTVTKDLYSMSGLDGL